MTQTTTAPMSVKKTAMITGASGGIGLELARLFARAGPAWSGAGAAGS